jgi:hypothetical protein
MKSFKELRTEAKQVWDKPNPKAERGESEKLSSSAKARARARAKAAGRPYPNMVDNIWAARNEETEIDEAGPFSYGAKPPKKGSVADLAAKKRKQQNTKPTEPKDQMVGTAKVKVDEAPAWTRKEGKSPSGGLNAKGIASYRRENPGSKLSMAVTTKPSKLDPDGKAAKRRKSFCARMSGVEGPMKKPNGEPTRKALALRKWNC